MRVLDLMRDLAALGGPVVMILLAMSLLAVSVVIYKLWQFRAAGVGRHAALRTAMAAADRGDAAGARTALHGARGYLAPVAAMALAGQRDPARLEAEAEARFATLERGLPALDQVAQLAPLLGLFGTVLGMITAFQAMQGAGAQVDPSVLAGGIWVALLTTAVGLAVAMPSSLAVTWFAARLDADRVLAGQMIRTLLSPGPATAAPQTQTAARLAPVAAHG